MFSPTIENQKLGLAYLEQASTVLIFLLTKQVQVALAYNSLPELLDLVNETEPFVMTKNSVQVFAKLFTMSDFSKNETVE